MRGGDGRVKKCFDGEAAEERLGDDQEKRAEAEDADPRARFADPDPRGQDERKNRDGAGSETMAPFPADAADHGRKSRAVRERPRRNGQTGLITGDQRSGNDEKKRAARGENGKKVKIAIPCFSQTASSFGYEIRKCKETV